MILRVLLLALGGVVAPLHADVGHVFTNSLGPWVFAPFVALLGSLATIPLLRADFWARYYHYIVLLCVAAFAIPFTMQEGFAATKDFFQTVMMAEYLPFAILIGTLYVVTGNIHIGHLYSATPVKNTVYLLCAGFCASIAGTTGAAMVFIRPFLSANDHRRHTAHSVVFYIFLVANVGGALTPLGDPPLFLGFLNGVPFLWPLKNLLFPTLLVFAFLLVTFYFIDLYFFRKEGLEKKNYSDPVVVKGKSNFMILFAVIALLVIAGSLENTPYKMYSRLVRDLGLIVCALLSYVTTSKRVRKLNGFDWHPLLEVMVVFWGFFLLVAPVVALLAKKHACVDPVLCWFGQGGDGVASRYFWGTGIFSSFLDNAPTYLVFAHMMNMTMADLVATLPRYLAAISAGAVFMGAMTYIGNAPNFMVKAIAEERNVQTPGFFGYMLWSLGILLPVLWVVDYIFFSGEFPFLSL